MLENLLGAPPPPPPPDVPALADGAENSARSLRERLEIHRANPACAVCHSRLDPLGFALEDFDAVGMFRTEDDGVEIEASGTLPDGTRVDGARGLRDVLLARRQEFVETLADKLLTLRAGSGSRVSDRPAVREIRRRVETQDYRFSALVAAIVDSVPFRLRRIPEHDHRKSVAASNFLRGVGTAVALPFLDAMTPAFAAPSAGVTRVAFVYTANRCDHAGLDACTGGCRVRLHENPEAGRAVS